MWNSPFIEVRIVHSPCDTRLTWGYTSAVAERPVPSTNHLNGKRLMHMDRTRVTGSSLKVTSSSCSKPHHASLSFSWPFTMTFPVSEHHMVAVGSVNESKEGMGLAVTPSQNPHL